MLGFRTFRARRRVIKAQAAHLAAQRRYDTACARRDTRARGETYIAMRAALHDLMAAETALNALAKPSLMRGAW